MKEVKTIFGAIIHVEELSHDRHHADREDETKIKFFDSKERYLDYFEVETIEENATFEGITPEEWLDKYVNTLESCETVEELCEAMGLEWYFMSTNWKAVVSYMLENGYLDEGEQISREKLLENEWVNIIGETYVVIAEC